MRHKIILTVCVVIFCVMTLIGCAKSEEEHTHSFDLSQWEITDQAHYHKATCGHDVKQDEDNHTFDEHGKCTVCKMQTVAIAANDVNAWIGYPASPLQLRIWGVDETPVLEYNTEKMTIDMENMTVTALATGDYTVRVTAGELEATFKVSCSEVSCDDWDRFSEDYAATLKATYMKQGRKGKSTVFIGDSYFHPGFFSNFDYYMGGADAFCFGICGATTADWENYVLEGMIFGDIAPKNIVVNLGTNDFYDDARPQTWVVSDLQRLFLLLHEKMPETQIYYFSITQRANILYERQVNKTNAQMQTWCENLPWITFVDISEEMTVEKLPDGIHPAAECYESVFLEALAAAGCVIEK